MFAFEISLWMLFMATRKRSYRHCMQMQTFTDTTPIKSIKI